MSLEVDILQLALVSRNPRHAAPPQDLSTTPIEADDCRVLAGGFTSKYSTV